MKTSNLCFLLSIFMLFLFILYIDGIFGNDYQGIFSLISSGILFGIGLSIHDKEKEIK